MICGKSKRISVATKMTKRQAEILSSAKLGTMRIVVKGSHIVAQVVYEVKVIKLERLSNIRSTTRRSRKNNHSLHTWSFYRLAMYVEYKAKLAGIKVLYVNPAFTSQKCPNCGNVHHADDRDCRCACGYHTHRDLLGARNICDSTEYVGDSNVRHTA